MNSFREYCILYRGPGFFAVVWFGSSPSPVSKLERRRTEKERQLPDSRVGGGGKSYDGEKPGPLKNHSVL
jgi:hypothetical protein